MNNALLALLAYIIDKIFGEFRFIQHPVIIIGELIAFFEKKLYNKTVFAGLLLVISMITIVTLGSFLLEFLLLQLPDTLCLILTSLIASMFLAHKMLYDSVNAVLYSTDKQETISRIVSRDTHEMDESDIYKAAMESYAENLSDGVVAPLFYLLLFGLPGIIIYKTINTLDSMIGYKNERYEQFGKVAARVDDAANFIPSRITAVLIMLVTQQKKIFAFYKDGTKHESPNAGHPITALAMVTKVSLGGDTSYFGKIKKKPYFGSGKKTITHTDLRRALSLKSRIDAAILLFLVLLYILNIL